jgi:hypothetical protein
MTTITYFSTVKEACTFINNYNGELILKNFKIYDSNKNLIAELVNKALD